LISEWIFLNINHSEALFVQAFIVYLVRVSFPIKYHACQNLTSFFLAFIYASFINTLNPLQYKIKVYTTDQKHLHHVLQANFGVKCVCQQFMAYFFKLKPFKNTFSIHGAYLTPHPVVLSH